MANTSTRMLQDGVELHYYIRIEGIGFMELGASKTLYVFSKIPDWSEGLTKKFIDGLHIPGSYSHSVDVIGGVESAGTLDFEFDEYFDGTGYQESPVWSDMFASSRALYHPDGASYPKTYLADTLLRAETSTITVADNTDFPSSGHVFIGNECITYTSKNGTTQLKTLSRGKHPVVTGQEFAYRHRFDESTAISAETAPIVTASPFTWFNRRIALYAFHRDQDGTWGTEAESMLLYKGIIESRAWTGEFYRFSTRSITSMLDRLVFTKSIVTRTTQGAQIPTHRGGIPYLTVMTYHTPDVLNLNVNGTGSFSLSSSHFGNPQDLREELNTAFQTEQGDNGDHLSLLPNTPDVLNEEYLINLNADASSADCVVFWAEPLRLYMRTGDGGAMPHFMAITSEAVANQPILIFPAHGTVLHRDETTLIRVSSVAGLVNRTLEDTGAISIDQGDGSGTGFMVVTGDDGDKQFIVRVWDSDTTLNPPELLVQPHEDLDIIPNNTLAHAPLVSIAGQAQMRECYVPLPSLSIFYHLLYMMTSTGESTSNGVYDVLPLDYGCGIPEDEVDVDAFVRFAGIFDGEHYPRRYVITKPTSLREIMEQEAKLLGVVFVTHNGQITIRESPDHAFRADNGVATLDEDNQDKGNERASYSESADGVYNAISIKHSYDPVREEFTGAPITIVDAASVDMFGQQRSLNIEHKGGRVSTASVAVAKLINRQLKFRFPFPRIDRSITRDLWGVLTLGDVVRFSDRTMPNQFTGEYGVSNLAGFIERISYDFKNRNGRVTVRLFPNDRVAPFAPSAEVSSYNAGTSTLTLVNTTFGGNMAGGNDTQMFAAGDEILICERNATNTAAADSWTRTIQSLTSTTITLDAALSSPAYSASKEYFVTYAAYATVDAGTNAESQFEQGSFQSGASGFIADSDGDFYPYTG